MTLIIIDPTYLNIQMDRREPDDPSPYLLAIWTPGITQVSGKFYHECKHGSQGTSDDIPKIVKEKQAILNIHFNKKAGVSVLRNS